MPISLADWVRQGARASDWRPDGVDVLPEPEPRHYDDGGTVETTKEVWTAAWVSKDNTSPPDFDTVAPEGGKQDIIDWFNASPSTRTVEFATSNVDGGPTSGKEFYGLFRVHGTINADLITGPTEINGTKDTTFTIDSDNTGADVDKALVFNRGSASPSAILAWLATPQRFDFNFPINATQILENGSPILGSPKFARFELWECDQEAGVDPFTQYESSQQGIIYNIKIEPSAPSYQCTLHTQLRIGSDFGSLLSSNDFEVYILRSPSSGMKCAITVRNQSGAPMGSIPVQPIDETGWSTALKTVTCSANAPSNGEHITADITFSDFLSGGWIKIMVPKFKYA